MKNSATNDLSIIEIKDPNKSEQAINGNSLMVIDVQESHQELTKAEKIQSE